MIKIPDNPIESHYNRLYSETETAFGGEDGTPESTVVKLPHYLTRGSILELGAGQGRNAVWLARHGFSVQAQDISAVGVAKMNRVAEAEKRAGMSQTTGAATTTTANSSSIDLERDGTQYLSAQNYPLFSITGDMTFESWINLESLPTPTPNGYKTIAGKYSNPGNQSGVQTSWLLYYVNNGVFGPRMSFYMMGNANGSSYIGLQWNLALATSTWHQVALVVTPAVPGIASKAKLYIDGVDQGAPVYTEGGGVTAIAFSTAPFAIGAHTYGQDSFDGKMDDVRLWNVARTAQEIQANYTHELSSTEPNLAAYWKFNNTYYDSTTNNNILTPINAPVFETDVPFGGGLIPASTFTSITATTTYAYSPAGDIVAINETNATPQLANSLTQKLYAYDDLHRLIHSETVPQNSPSTRYDYAYNAIGNMTAQGRNGATTTYLYEGNLGNSFANPNAATKMIPPSGPQLVLSYDQNGNLLSDPITGTTNVWNYRNELVSTTKGATTTQYTYDAGGIRDTINDGSTLQTFPSPSYSETVDLLSGERTIEKHISGITFETKYANATSSPTNREFSTIADHLGSTEKVMDSNHAVVEDVTYDPFGKIISDVSTSDFSEKRKYTSHELDAETGYTYAKARYLNTETARFISEDPAFWNISDALLADPQQQNSYSYARNNPIKYVDPDGRRLVISGAYGSEFSQNTFNTLQQLNPHIKINDNNEVKINFWYRVGSWFRSDEPSLQLLKEVIDNDNIVSINQGKTRQYEAEAVDSIKAQNGDGSAAKIYFDDKETTQIDLREYDPKGNEGKGSVFSNPAEKRIIMGHELIHSSHFLDGTFNPKFIDYKGLNGENYYDRFEEVRTVGLCCNNNRDVTENDLRREFGLYGRNDY